MLCNADTHADTSWPRSMLMVLSASNQTSVRKSGRPWNETEEEQQKKIFH